MTQEQKAKAYDEAIRKLRGMMPNWENLSYNGKTFLQDIVSIFPELTENKDEEIRKAISIYLDWLDGRKDCAPRGEHSIRDMIAWLERQKQKSSNWNEEDDKAINDIMWIIEAYRKNGFNETHIQMADSSEKWLKFLKQRYAWKPSEKQMKALHDMNLTGNISYAGQGQALIELYNDLKKLKGESELQD